MSVPSLTQSSPRTETHIIDTLNMNKEAINDDVLKYQACLSRIQWHLGFIEAVGDKGQRTASLHDPPTEMIFLHFRKALEELAFSSLSANVEKYSEAHANFSVHWQSKNILKEIAKINPHFFPIPVPRSDYSIHAPAEPEHDSVMGDSGCLTRDDFEFLYSLTSKALHAGNPYKPATSDVNMKYTVSEWVERFRRLLRVHLIQFVDSEEVWTAMMSDINVVNVGVARLVVMPPHVET